LHGRDALRCPLGERQKRHARALGRKCVVNIVAEIDGIARRRSIEQHVQPFGVRLPFLHIVQSDGAAKQAVRGAVFERVAQLVARAAGE